MYYLMYISHLYTSQDKYKPIRPLFYNGWYYTLYYILNGFKGLLGQILSLFSSVLHLLLNNDNMCNVLLQLKGLV